MSVVIVLKRNIWLSIGFIAIWLFLPNSLLGSTFQEDSLRAYKYLKLSEKHMRTELDSSKFYNQKALKLSIESGVKKHEAHAYVNISYFLSSEGKLDESMEYLKKAELIFTEIRDLQNLAYNILNQASRYQSMGDYSSALRSFFLCQTYFQESNDSSGLSLAYSRMGVTFTRLNQPRKALEYQFKSLAINEARDFQLGVTVNWNNLATNYKALGDFDSAMFYLTKALAGKQALKDKTGVTRVLMNLGVVNTMQGHFAVADSILKIGLAMAREQGLVKEESEFHVNMADLYLEQGLVDDALRESNLGFKLTDRNQYPLSLLYSYKNFSKVYEMKGDYQKALKYLQLTVQLNDSLLPKDLALSMVENEAKMAAAKKQTEIELLQTKSDLDRQNIEYQQRQKWWFFVLFALMAITAIVLLRSYRLKLRTNAKLLHLGQLKGRFFANLSHEFKTPLALIIGPLRSLQEHTYSQKERHSLDRALRNAERLIQLNEQLLDLVKIDSEVLAVKLVDGDVIAFLRSTAEVFQALADQKEIQYKVKLSPAQYEGSFDPDKLEKVLNNLLSNAFKFTPKGGEVQLVVDAGKSLSLSVLDSGSGISTEEQKHIFDRYYSTEVATNSGQAGNGIGLSLAKELVHLMGGEIGLESSLGQGSQFTVELPVERSLKTANPRLMDIIPSINFEPEDFSDKPLLLVVDDIPDIRALVKEQFETSYRILEAENGKEALEIAVKELPDIVVSDLMMPVMDGLELCSQLKADSRTSHIPMVLLTALSSIESRIEGLETGADDYLNKPFHGKELQVRVANLIKQREQLRMHFAKQFEVNDSPETALPNTEQVFYNRLTACIQDHIADSELTVDFLGREIGMSRVQLYRKVKAVTAQSPSQLIRVLRLHNAAGLLCANQSNVSEAMYASGFDSPSYFAKVFRKEYGCSPSEYKGNSHS